MLTEFDNNETCTAVITSHLESGENYDGAVSIGHYADAPEIWIAANGSRFHLQLVDVDVFCKQLKRAKTLAVAASLSQPKEPQ